MGRCKIRVKTEDSGLRLHLGWVALKHGRVIDRIFPGSDGRGDERHQDIAYSGTMQRLVEEATLENVARIVRALNKAA